MLLALGQGFSEVPVVSDPADFTQVFRDAEDGSAIDLDSVMPALYDELRGLAAGTVTWSNTTMQAMMDGR